MSVYLWQADGPRQGARGVSDDERRARRAAADLLRCGQASSALIEEAAAELGERTLNAGYYAIGQKWRARVGAQGHVTWEPAGTAAR